MSSVAEPRAQTDDFTAEWHVYEPHKVGLPPLRSYFRALWKRRELLVELARTDLRAQHFNTTLGQLWLILNPVMLGVVYFTLVYIIRGSSRGSEFLAHLLMSLFVFRLVTTSISAGARSVVGGGRLILNTAFPRLVLPLESVLESILRFLPTVLVFAVVFVVVGLPVGPQLLWVVPILVLVVVFAAGASMFTATAQVYFRDLANFLPYFTRIWLYTSPVLFYAEDVPQRLKPILVLNPMYPSLTALNDVVVEGKEPPFGLLALALAWAVATVVAGTLFFISRERGFAIGL
jgi:teichoic acid transport system permease protein